MKCVINADLYPCNGQTTCDLPLNISYDLSTPSFKVESSILINLCLKHHAECFEVIFFLSNRKHWNKGNITFFTPSPYRDFLKAKIYAFFIPDILLNQKA